MARIYVRSHLFISVISIVKNCRSFISTYEWWM